MCPKSYLLSPLLGLSHIWMRLITETQPLRPERYEAPSADALLGAAAFAGILYEFCSQYADGFPGSAQSDLVE